MTLAWWALRGGRPQTAKEEAMWIKMTRATVVKCDDGRAEVCDVGDVVEVVGDIGRWLVSLGKAVQTNEPKGRFEPTQETEGDNQVDVKATPVSRRGRASKDA